MHTDAPPGSGLGSSSTVVVALISLFADYFQKPMTPYEIAELAWEVERVDLGLKGGMQDQYCATFGGFNFIEYSADNVVVTPLRLPADTLNELHYDLILCYTGQTRPSAGIIDDQVQHIARNDADALAATHALKDLCIQMKNALLRARLTEFGELLHESWMQKRRIATNITNPKIDTLYDEARNHGAIGGKLLGAGGGGYLLVFTPFTRKHIILERLEAAGGQPIDFNFDHHGAVTWRVPE
jgi:D-glycero-alpha-D-manno-heptose-7-phosphate kinase